MTAQPTEPHEPLAQVPARELRRLRALARIASPRNWPRPRKPPGWKNWTRWRSPGRRRGYPTRRHGGSSAYLLCGGTRSTSLPRRCGAAWDCLSDAAPSRYRRISLAVARAYLADSAGLTKVLEAIDALAEDPRPPNAVPWGQVMTRLHIALIACFMRSGRQRSGSVASTGSCRWGNGLPP
jgi:hypothetical protein